MDGQEKEQAPQRPSWADRLRERSEAQASSLPPTPGAPQRTERKNRKSKEKRRGSAPRSESAPPAPPVEPAADRPPRRKLIPFPVRAPGRKPGPHATPAARFAALRQGATEALGRARARVGGTRYPHLQRRQLTLAGVGLGAFLLGALAFGLLGADTDLARLLSGAAILDDRPLKGQAGAEPVLALRAWALPDPVPAGEPLTYSLWLTNSAEVTLTLTVLGVAPHQVMPAGALHWTPVLPPAAAWTHTFSVTVPPAARGVLTSVVLAVAREGASAAYTVTTPIAGTPRLAVAHGPEGPARAGTLLTYTLRVTNTGNVDLHAAVTAAMPNGAGPGRVHTWQPMIPGPAAHRPGGVWTVQVPVTIPVGYAGSLASRVEVTTREGASARSEQVVAVRAVPDLALAQRAGPDPATAGALLTYTLAVTNTGNVDLHPTVTATLPEQVTAASDPPAAAEDGTLTWTPSVLAPGEAWRETVAVTVTPGYAGTLTNVLHVASDEGAAAVSTLAVPSLAPRMAISQTVTPRPARPGEPLTFTLSVTNLGNLTLHCAVVDLLPRAPEVFGASIERWAVTLPPAGRPGDAWTRTLVVTVAADYTGPLTNVVEVTSLEGASAVHTATLLSRASRLKVVTLDQPDPILAGSYLTYTLAITNAGNDPVLITVRDTLPEDVIPVLARSAGAARPVLSGRDKLVWPPVTLDPADVWTVTVPVSVPDTCSGVLTNVLAIGTPDGTDVYTLTTLAHASVLTVGQSFEPRVVVAGRSLTFTLSITNLGNVDVHAVVLDYLPAPITPSLPVAWWITTIPAAREPEPGQKGPAIPGVWSATVALTPTEDYADINLTDLLTNYVEIVTFEGDWLTHTFTLPLETAPAGLAISTTAPTPIGEPTILTGTVVAGHLVQYTWNLGDGSPLVKGYENVRDGYWLEHTYDIPGLYTVVLTATNAYGATTATLPIYVYTPHWIYLPLVYD